MGNSSDVDDGLMWLHGNTLQVTTPRDAPEDLVDEHAAEDADEDADHGEAEHGAEAGVDRPVDHLARRRQREHVAERGCSKYRVNQSKYVV